MNSELTFKQGLKDTTPTVFGYIGIGIAFGMIGNSEGFSVWVIFITLIDCLRWFSTIYHG
ncbi:azaleucine resistance protein AzlC, azlC [Lactococcus lactis subsp. lactis]|nr:azaleucine resistance protein AzlC, azlC [Lactococcus lactis subsp. lactis]